MTQRRRVRWIHHEGGGPGEVVGSVAFAREWREVLGEAGVLHEFDAPGVANFPRALRAHIRAHLQRPSSSRLIHVGPFQYSASRNSAASHVLEGVRQAAAMVRVIYLKQKRGVVTGQELDSAA